MAVSSSRLGISGECDAVEFKKASSGISVFGLDGNYTVAPIEYKRGKPKEDNCDIMQLTAQALCLEEMLCCEIPFGYMYYGETHHRLKVEFDASIREKTENAISEMHRMYRQKHTPKVKRTKSCNACSLKNICLPVLCGNKKASDYVREMLGTEEST
jgi:CRISPR-associated exonuclease Cas4